MQSGTGRLSCSRTALKRCTSTETRWYRWLVSLVLLLLLLLFINQLWHTAYIVITHSHGSESVVRATTEVNGEMGNSTPCQVAMPKPHNRSSPKVIYVIISRISTKKQNLVTIPQGVSFPRMCEIAQQKCFLGFFFSGSSILAHRPAAPEPIFTQNMSNDVVPRKYVPFRSFWDALDGT